MKRVKRRFQKKVFITLFVILVIQSISGCMEQKPPLTIKGCIVSEDGSAIANVKVSYLQKETFTDEEGCFALEASPGTGNLSLSKDGFIEVRTYIDVSDSIDVGTMILLEKYGDITVIEEVTEYEPGSAAENVFSYYSTTGFDELGTIKAEYAAVTEPLYITVLVTSTQSAFVIESDGAVGIMFDFSEKRKELYMGDIVFTAAFGGEWYVQLFSEQELVWNSEDDEDFQELFSEKMEEASDAAEFIKRIESITEDSVHPDILLRARESSEAHIHRGVNDLISSGIAGSLQYSVWDSEQKVHLLKRRTPASEYTAKIFDVGHLPMQQPEFVTTVALALRGIINPPGGVGPPPIHWIIKELAKMLREIYKSHQARGNDLKKRLEDSKKDMENQKKDLENKKKNLEEQKEDLKKQRQDLEKNKKNLEDIKRDFEKLLEEFKYYGTEAKRIENEIKKLEETIEKLDEAIKKLDNEIENLDKEIKNFDKEIKDCDNTIKNLEDTIKKVEEELKKIEESIKTLEEIIIDC